MTITAIDFLNNSRFDIFSGVSETAVQAVIDSCYRELPEAIWIDENIRDEAVLLLSAHKLRIERADVFAQSAIQKSIDENEEIKIQSIDLKQPYLKQTIYGQEFELFRRRNLGSIGIC